MRPRWEEIEKEYPWLETEYFEFDESKDAVNTYNIMDKLPVFIFLDKKGKEFLRLEGEISKNKLTELITSNKDK